MVFGLETIGKFFDWLFNVFTSISVGIQLFFLMVFFFAIQIGFVFAYVKIGMYIWKIKPQVEYMIERMVGEFAK